MVWISLLFFTVRKGLNNVQIFHPVAGIYFAGIDYGLDDVPVLTQS